MRKLRKAIWAIRNFFAGRNYVVHCLACNRELLHKGIPDGYHTCDEACEKKVCDMSAAY